MMRLGHRLRDLPVLGNVVYLKSNMAYAEGWQVL